VDRAKPMAIELSETVLDGRPAVRASAILAAPGCSWARATGGCTFCGFLELSTRGAEVSVADYEKQAQALVAAIGARGAGEVDLYNSGSFLAEDEIPAEARSAILARVAAVPGLQRVLIEARPADLTVERLAPLVALLPRATLEVGIGLETADDSLRERALRKGFSFDAFQRAASLLHESGATLLAYVLVKPPGLSEEQALRDAIGTVTAIAALRDRLSASGRPFQVRAALQPAFVARGTRLEQEYVAGQYEVPSLWTVRDVVLATHPLLPLQVALWDEGLADGRVAKGCSACTPKLREALGRFNATGETAALESVVCSSCRPPAAPSPPAARSSSRSPSTQGAQ
jgi:radical SAM enzyme (TIGR01210 family)